MDDIRAPGPAQATSARIRRSRDSICQDWLAAVRARVPAAKDKPASLIIDSLPECILHYAAWMAGESSAQQKLRELGKEHGEQRSKLGGFSLDQILLEYSLLREVMLGVLQREEPLAAPELRRLLAALDESTATSSVEFVRLEHARFQAELPPVGTDLRAVVDGLPDGILIVDRQWRITYVNVPALRVLYGDSERVPRMLQGHSLWEDPPTLGDSRLFKGQIDAMERHQAVEFEEHLPSLGQWLRVTITPSPEGFVTLFRDVTATRTAQEALDASQTSFRMMVNSVKDHAIFMLDAEGKVSTWNEGAERIKGYKAEEIIGQHFRRLYMPEDAKAGRPERNLQRARLCGFATDEWWRCRKNGSPFWASLTITAMYDEEGKLQGYAKILQDLTERKRIEEQQNFLANLGAVLSASLDSDDNLRKLAHLIVPLFASWCVIHTVEPGRSGRICLMHHESPEKQRLLEELERLQPDFLELAGGPRKVMRTGQSVLVSQVDTSMMAAFARDERHMERLRELGFEKYVSIPLVARGHMVGALTLVSSGGPRQYDADFVAFAEDVGRRVAMSIDNARLYRETERAVRLRDHIVAVVSHDLRNPLTAIGGAAALLKRTQELGEKAAVVHRNADLIGRSVERMSRLISDLLDAARIEAEGLAIAPEETPLDVLMEEVTDAFEPIAHERSIRLVVDRKPRDCRLFVDRGRIFQVFSNLVGNALKFTPAGGQVTVFVEGCDEEARFCVKDTGPGVKEADLPHIFDAYWQAEHTRSAGAGLGLAIAKGIVEAHGGRIWAESIPGEGAAFYFTLPRTERPRSKGGNEDSEPGKAMH
ncbi:PAS domain S-box-containing protein [Archangium gephyra]|uniref:histidine kinase n=1 Tax=Archangium gephyra TaxID=48 RepID=A0AAC8Q5K4_9BACT|nr:ATP-binding protein [Archangium gephyra]AKJ01495.1 sensory box histidine kinase/response regulator [Archangium gephyra]REG34310.1 PAS domain S-box-containing protein [Archangium gephyra]